MPRMRPSILLVAVLALSSVHYAYSLACSLDATVETCGEVTTCDHAQNVGTMECYKGEMCCTEWLAKTRSFLEEGCDVPKCEHSGDFTIAGVDECLNFETQWMELVGKEGCDVMVRPKKNYDTFCRECTESHELFKGIMNTFTDPNALQDCEFDVDGSSINAKKAMNAATETFAGICVQQEEKYCTFNPQASALNELSYALIVGYAEVQELMQKQKAAELDVSVSSSSGSSSSGESTETVEVTVSDPQLEEPADSSASQETSQELPRRMLLESTASTDVDASGDVASSESPASPDVDPSKDVTSSESPSVAPMHPPYGITRDEMCQTSCSMRAVAYIITSLSRPFMGDAIPEPNGRPDDQQGIAVGEPNPSAPPDAQPDPGRPDDQQGIAVGEPNPSAPPDAQPDPKPTSDTPPTRRMALPDDMDVDVFAQIKASCAMTDDEYNTWVDTMAKPEAASGGMVEDMAGGVVDEMVKTGVPDADGDLGVDAVVPKAVMMSMKVTMQVSEEDFTESKQGMFKQAVKTASGADAVEIVGIVAINTARRRMLLAAGIEVETKLQFPADKDVSSLTATDLTTSINKELEIVAPELAVKVTEMKEVTDTKDDGATKSPASPLHSTPPLLAALLLALSAVLA